MDKQKITITIEDIDGSVEVISTPSFGEIMKNMTEREPTAAECYAISALNKIRDVAAQADKGLAEVQVPMIAGPKLVEPEVIEN